MAALPILFVDDPDTCAALADVLSHLGYLVDMALDGLTALRLVGRDRRGLALLAYRMPDTNGLDLFRDIRRLRPDVTGIILTAFATRDLIDQAAKAGAVCPLQAGGLWTPFAAPQGVVGRPPGGLSGDQ